MDFADFPSKKTVLRKSDDIFEKTERIGCICLLFAARCDTILLSKQTILRLNRKFFKKEPKLSKTVKIILSVLLVAVLGVGIYFTAAALMRNDRELNASQFDQLARDA